jgi:predicted amidohydrolase
MWPPRAKEDSVAGEVGAAAEEGWAALAEVPAVVDSVGVVAAAQVRLAEEADPAVAEDSAVVAADSAVVVADSAAVAAGLAAGHAIALR